MRSFRVSFERNLLGCQSYHNFSICATVSEQTEFLEVTVRNQEDKKTKETDDEELGHLGNLLIHTGYI